jgi:hypothetical protein
MNLSAGGELFFSILKLGTGSAYVYISYGYTNSPDGTWYPIDTDHNVDHSTGDWTDNAITLPALAADGTSVYLRIHFRANGTVSPTNYPMYSKANFWLDDFEITLEPPTPVELSSFTAVFSYQNFSNLTWVTQSETGVNGFYIYRNTSDDLATAEIISPMISATNTSQPQTYIYTDTELYDSGTYYYWLQNVDFDGSVFHHGPISVVNSNTQDNPAPPAPLLTDLEAIYPNPFNPTAFIPFSLANEANVSFQIYNPRGQIVRHIDLGTKAAGKHRITWDGRDSRGGILPNGVYYIRMNAGNSSFQRKALLLK